jgi:hypothetical protein
VSSIDILPTRIVDRERSAQNVERRRSIPHAGILRKSNRNVERDACIRSHSSARCVIIACSLLSPTSSTRSPNDEISYAVGTDDASARMRSGSGAIIRRRVGSTCTVQGTVAVVSTIQEDTRVAGENAAAEQRRLMATDRNGSVSVAGQGRRHPQGDDTHIGQGMEEISE